MSTKSKNSSKFNGSTLITNISVDYFRNDFSIKLKTEILNFEVQKSLTNSVGSAATQYLTA